LGDVHIVKKGLDLDGEINIAPDVTGEHRGEDAFGHRERGRGVIVIVVRKGDVEKSLRHD